MVTLLDLGDFLHVDVFPAAHDLATRIEITKPHGSLESTFRTS
jgi:hypothetical protein